jgi:hypothetical protein
VRGWLVQLAAGAAAGWLSLGAAVAASAELRSVEAVGAAPVTREGAPPRDAALRRALQEAVRQVALEMLPDLDEAEADAVLEPALGDPFAYATRYRIVDDRGERPALFIEDPEVDTEYVLVVRAQVDVERVRERLERRGLLGEPSGDRDRHRLRVVIQDIDSYASYMAVRTLLDDLRVRSAVPVEMEQGTAVLEVESDRSAAQLLKALMRAAPPELRIQPLGADAETLTLRARFLPPLGGPTR